MNLTRRGIVVLILLGMGVVVLLIDLGLLIAGWPTVSQSGWWLVNQSPIIPFLSGVVAGHFFWPLWQGDKVDLKPDEHVVVMSNYEIANLRSAIETIGYGTVVPRNPIMALNTGDWVGQIYNKLPQVNVNPNHTPQQLAQRALEKYWHPEVKP